MTTRIYKILSAAAVLTSALMFYGCDVYTTHLCPSYILRYTEADGIKLSYHNDWEYEDTDNCIWIDLTFPGQDLIKDYSLTDKGKEKEMYDSLCRKHNDIGYNRKRSWYVLPPFPSSATSDFLSIEIFSDADYDEAHPAGTNLADIVRYMGFSPYQYILSGYKDSYYYNPSEHSSAFNKYLAKFSNRGAYFAIDKMVPDLTPEDLTLPETERTCMLHFEVAPTLASEHNITVKIHTDDGKVFSASIPWKAEESAETL